MDKEQSKKPSEQQRDSASSANEGEGSRTAALDYDKRTEAFIRSGKVEESAKKAEKAIDGPERKELSKAEKMGRSHAKR